MQLCLGYHTLFVTCSVLLSCCAGCEIPGLPDVLDAVLAAHMVAAPDLPLVGWDVALTAGIAADRRAGNALAGGWQVDAAKGPPIKSHAKLLACRHTACWSCTISGLVCGMLLRTFADSYPVLLRCALPCAWLPQRASSSWKPT